MKRVILINCLALLALVSRAQTNTFPADGNAGIGTTNPENAESWEKVLEVKGGIHAKSLVSTNSIITGTWSHNNGIYGAPPGGIAGTYSSHSYTLITNKQARFSIASNGNVGIGTTAPATSLHVVGQFTLENSSGNATLFTGTGTAELNKYLALLNSPDLSSASGLKAGGVLIADDYNYSQPGKNDLVVKGAAAIGATAVPSGYKFAVSGKAVMEEVNVRLRSNWPDYVFKPSYNLTPLSEIKDFIKQNGHLPDVPSAKEVSEKGIEIGANQAVLLKKIEELTLHLIEMEEKQKVQEEKITEQKENAMQQGKIIAKQAEMIRKLEAKK